MTYQRQEGKQMSNPSPKALRAFADRCGKKGVMANYMRACADAWEAEQLHRAEEIELQSGVAIIAARNRWEKEELVPLRQRLEETKQDLDDALRAIGELTFYYDQRLEAAEADIRLMDVFRTTIDNLTTAVLRLMDVNGGLRKRLEAATEGMVLAEALVLSHEGHIAGLERRLAAAEKTAGMVKKAFGGWLPRSEHTNVPHDMTDALAALFAALDCLHTWTPAYDNQWVCQKCGLRMEAKCGGATALAAGERLEAAEVPSEDDKQLYRNDVVVFNLANMLAKSTLEYGPDKVRSAVRCAAALAAGESGK